MEVETDVNVDMDVDALGLGTHVDMLIDYLYIEFHV